MAPLPQPRSSTRASSGRSSASAASIGLRSWDQGVVVAAQRQRPELASACQVGDRLTRLPALQQAFEFGAFDGVWSMFGVGVEPRAVMVEHVRQKDLGV